MNRYKLLLVTALLAGFTGDMGLRADDLDQKNLTRSDIEAIMDSLSNWGRWGEDDQLGALNLITPAKRKQAAKLVQEGISISIAHESVKEETDQSSPFEHTVTVNSQLGPIGSAAMFILSNTTVLPKLTSMAWRTSFTETSFTTVFQASTLRQRAARNSVSKISGMASSPRLF